MPGSVLVVEHDQDVAELIRRHLKDVELDVTLARSGPEALSTLARGEFALAVIDIDLPGMEGLVLPGPPRAPTPVLMVSADADKAHVLELGADDFLTKPFSPIELVARVRALLRRASSSAPPPLAIGDITIDMARREVRRAERVVTTTGLEFQLLHVLASRPGRVFSRDDLLRQVWGPGRVVEPRAVDNLVSRLRQKLEADPDRPRLFVTVWGSGYRFDPPE